ncbi:MAG: hypothetical protein RSD63_06255 [Eubacterium sp.]
MGNFELHTGQLQAEESNLANIYNALSVTMMQLWLPIMNLRLYCFLKGSNLDQKLSDNYNYLKNQRRNVFHLKRGLKEIMNSVQNGEMDAENVICQLYARLTEPFNERGEYGGNQNSPYINGLELIGIVRKYYPYKNEKEIEKFLQDINKEGCGYVACANTVFTHYVGRAEEFKKTFGFSMYKEDGNPNYDALITDFYASTDNHHGFGGIDIKNPFENNKIMAGVTPEELEYRFELYMRKHGVNVDVKSNNIEITPENFKEMNRTSDVIIYMKPVRLIKENGDIYNSPGGRHFVKIVEVTDDGRYAVSSWGEKYYLDFIGNYDKVHIQTIKYK